MTNKKKSIVEQAVNIVVCGIKELQKEERDERVEEDKTMVIKMRKVIGVEVRNEIKISFAEGKKKKTKKKTRLRTDC